MSISHLLDDFGAYAKSSAGDLTDVLLEEERLEAFEKGYQAGWEDSARAQQDMSRHISADFAQSLKDLSFTYQEAYCGLMRGLKPLIEQIVETILPRLGRETLAPRVAELVEEMLGQHGRQPVHLVTAPANIPRLEDLVGNDAGFPVKVDSDSSMAEGQVHIRFGEVAEHEIDLTDVVESIGRAVTTYFHSETSDQKDIA